MNANKTWMLLILEGSLFIAAALVHFGILARGYEHSKAAPAETTIGIVLFAGLVLGLIFPLWSRVIALAAQGFALFGTFVGLFTIAIGIGPRTIPDLVFHAFIVAILIAGLVVTARSRSGPDNELSPGSKSPVSQP